MGRLVSTGSCWGVPLGIWASGFTVLAWAGEGAGACRVFQGQQLGVPGSVSLLRSPTGHMKDFGIERGREGCKPATSCARQFVLQVVESASCGQLKLIHVLPGGCLRPQSAALA